jgi:PKD repeat protein
MTFYFDASASYDPDGPVVEYFWDFGDGGSATGVNPSYTYTVAGCYDVQLGVKDLDGLTDGTTHRVTAHWFYDDICN